MKQMNFFEHFNTLCRELNSHGVFLTVKDRDGRVNVMTIGWATAGIIWSRPVMTVLVRPVRYTHDIIENASTFTVSVPEGHNLEKELMYCGTTSGRGVDKAAKAGITLVPGMLANSLVVKECKYFYECEIIHKNVINAKTLSKEIVDDLYTQKDFHSIYYGEIKHSYAL